MSVALSWSGGKDSTLALDRALSLGLPVSHLFNIYDATSGRVRFHGVRRELIQAQAEALGLELIQRASSPDEFEPVFLSILDHLAAVHVTTVLFGNIHLEDVRAWYEERTLGRGFEHREPLWGQDTEELLKEFVSRGHRAVVVSVDGSRGDPGWLGQPLDAAFVAEVAGRPDVDPCGEHGEFHTFVHDGPLFRSPISIRTGERIESEGHHLIDLIPA